ncbi:MAG: S8 family serine peptidase, partial [Defluviitaleaceae bacterium]|nr:S8 family serine peptidase [Defluviitaleaceae bacterium]
MNSKKLKTKKFQSNLRRGVAGFLTVLMTVGAAPAIMAQPAELPYLPRFGETQQVEDLTLPTSQNVLVAAFQEELAQSRLAAREAVNLESQFSGLIGFEGAYALTGGSEPVSVIVVFENAPAGIQVLEAEEEGGFMPFAAAEQIVEDDHDLFRRELNALFGANQFRRDVTPFEITSEWRFALNGVAITIPSFMVEQLLNFESVRAIYPNETVTIDPITETAMDDMATIASLMTADIVGPPGVRAGRAMTNADALHAQGITGEGVLMAIIDSGIDYNHPAFWGSFPTMEEMHARGALHITEADLILAPNADGELEYFYVGRDFMPGVSANPNPNSPMETRPGHPGNPTVAQLTSHGTHVSGIAMGRYTGAEGMLGIAPGAMAVHYRSLGFGGSGVGSSVVDGIERVALDRPDVVNISISGAAGPFGASTIAVNNIVVQFGTIFTNSAGNAGPGFHTLTGPANAPTGITVAMNAVAVPGQYNFGLNFTAGDIDGTISFMGGQTMNPVMWRTLDNDRIVSNHPNAHENFNPATGEMRIFTMPITPGSPASAGNAVVNAGGGNQADFDQLYYLYGEELEGAWVVIRRGYAFTVAADRARDMGLAGVISVNNPGAAIPSGQAPSQFDPYYALFAIGHELGVEFVNTINYNEGQMNFVFTDFAGDWPITERVNIGSSRGPVDGSYDIRPDIGSHGEIVLSSVPWWTVDNDDYDYTGAYRWFSGTSMSAPTVAGVAALILDYLSDPVISHDNDTLYSRWGVDYWEVRARIMNNAYSYPRLGSFYNAQGPLGFPGVFDTGAGGADAYAGAKATAMLTSPLSRVGTAPGRFGYTTQAGSMSFGLLGLGEVSTLTAYLHNGQIESVTHEFFTNVRNAGHDIGLEIAQPSPTTFTATIEMPEDAAYMGLHFQGQFTVVTTAGETLRMPFAAVLGTPAQAGIAITEIFTYRPVVSTGDNAQNQEASELGIFYVPQSGFTADMWVVRDVEGVTAANWYHSENREHIVGFVSSRVVANWHPIFAPNPANINFALGELNRAVVPLASLQPLSGPALIPPGATPRVPFNEEGDFFLVMGISEQLPGTFGFVPPTRFSQDIFVPFSVDNTAPVFNAVNINGHAVDLDEQILDLTTITDATENNITVTGNVFDAWLADAIADNVTFDIWRESIQIPGFPAMPNPFGPAVNLPTNLALWVLAGDNEEGNRPVLAEIAPNGNFTATLPTTLVEGDNNLTFWLIDGYSVIPTLDSILGTPGWSAVSSVWTNPGLGWFDLEANGGLVSVHENVQNLSINQAFIHGFNRNNQPGTFSQHIWSGLNVNELNVTVSTPIFVTGIEIQGDDEITLITGGSVQLVAIVSPEDATHPYYAWSTSDATVATV